MEKIIKLMYHGWDIQINHTYLPGNSFRFYVWTAKNGVHDLKSKTYWGSPENCIQELLKTIEEIDEEIE